MAVNVTVLAAAVNVPRALSSWAVQSNRPGDGGALRPLENKEHTTKAHLSLARRLLYPRLLYATVTNAHLGNHDTLIHLPRTVL